MKLKIFIVRYKEDLTPILTSLYNNNFDNTSINIINNFGEIYKNNNSFYKNLTIFNNTIRPDFSSGHLSRSWNQALINGFKDLNNPDCDIVMCIQADSLLKENFYNAVLNFYNSSYIFSSSGRGDECMLFKPEIIKRVGLFDERYCNICYQEGDYFLRCFLREPERVLILDYLHGRLVNNSELSEEEKFIPITIIFPSSPSIETTRSISHSYYSYKNYMKKWKGMNAAEHWNKEHIKSLELSIEKKEIVLYPYFEKDIDQIIYE